MSFGKYKGTPIISIPVAYLKWLGKRLAYVDGGGYLDSGIMPTFIGHEEYQALMVALDEANGFTPTPINHESELEAVLAKPNLKHYISTPHVSVIKSDIEKSTGVPKRCLLIRCVGRRDQWDFAHSDHSDHIDWRPMLSVSLVDVSKKQFRQVQDYVSEHCDRWAVSEASIMAIKEDSR